MNRYGITLYRYAGVIILVLQAAIGSWSVGGEPTRERFPAADGPGVTAYRADRQLILELSEPVRSPITIPRVAAPVHEMFWESANADRLTSTDLVLHPEPQLWLIRWKTLPDHQAARLVLTFDAPVLLVEELPPAVAAGDGSVWLPAHRANTSGEKIRYEPQPYKNTIGYWVVPADLATWSFSIDRPGRFNVGILQGCGKGQGGSLARMDFYVVKNQESAVTAQETLEEGVSEPFSQLTFTVEETGHFQNFRWRHVGEVELDAGRYRLVLRAQRIEAKALMDVRAIHLVRQPDK